MCRTDEFIEAFEKFARENCAIFKGVTFEGEQPLSCMEVCARQLYGYYPWRRQLAPGSPPEQLAGCWFDLNSFTSRRAQVYKSFQALYEGKLETFLADEGIEAPDFAAALQSVMGSDTMDNTFVEVDFAR